MSQPLPYSRSNRVENGISRRPRPWLWVLRLFLVSLVIPAIYALTSLYIAVAKPGPLSSVFVVNFVAYGTIIASIALVFLGSVQRSSRQRRAKLVLDHVAFAVQSNLPLLAMLYAAERGESGFTRKRLEALRRRLSDGLPLQGALSLAVPELSIRELAILGSAERSGALPTALATLTESRADAPGEPNMRASLLSLSAVVLFFIVVMGGAVGFLVLPRYGPGTIGDAVVSFPALRRLLESTWVLQMIAFPIAALLLVGFMITAIDRLLRIPRRQAPFIWLRDQIAHRTPFLTGFVRDRAMADGLRAASQAIDAGRPLPLAIGEAGQTHLNIVWQNRFDDFARFISAGVEFGPAALNAKMPRTVAQAAALGANGNTGLAATLVWIAEFHAARLARRQALVNSITPILVTLVAGAIVYSGGKAFFSDMAYHNMAMIRSVENQR